jgi:diadenosine tetraphosphate (Ap4A) HIT family hydrolase
MSRDRWDALVRGEACPVCAEVGGPGQDNPDGYFVADLRVSRLRLQREQHVPGWCVLLFRGHVREPHELPQMERIAFFEDMVRVGRALDQVYAALKINYSILGNNVPHLHAHIQPRYHGDLYPGGVVNPAPGESLILTDSEARDQIRRIRSAMLE